MGVLYLVPTTLGESPTERVIPIEVNRVVSTIRYFIVENIRTVRRYLRKLDPAFPIDDCQFYELNEHTDPKEMHLFLKPLEDGNDMAIISEAGCPGVADPGSDVVRIAHQRNIRVVPMVGPSSILLSLMASGMNGQHFAFAGYIPVKNPERSKVIREMERRSQIEHQTQIFIEAPYRNLQLFQDLLTHLSEHTRLCIACDVTLESEYIRTLTVAQWKREKPDIQKRPAIFLFQREG